MWSAYQTLLWVLLYIVVPFAVFAAGFYLCLKNNTDTKTSGALAFAGGLLMFITGVTIGLMAGSTGLKWGLQEPEIPKPGCATIDETKIVITFEPDDGLPEGAEWWVFHNAIQIPGTRATLNADKKYVSPIPMENPAVYWYYQDERRPPSRPYYVKVKEAP